LWKKRLAEFEAPVMDVAKKDALEDFVARKKTGMGDAWY
jgi:trimethylamine--corrinoid protein Co-methyltransferase